MKLLAGTLQIIGFALLFTPLLVVGIIAIVIGAVLFFLGDKADEKSTKKMLNEMADNSKTKLKTFESNFGKNPFSAETEKAYNNLPKFSRPNLGNYTLSDAELNKPYRDRLAMELDRFEKAYVSKGEKIFREEELRKNGMLDTHNLYDRLCKCLGRPIIPELLEDFQIYCEEAKSNSDDQKTALDKRLDFLKQRIKELEDEGKERRVIQSRVMSEFKKTFSEEINLRRLNGKWLAKGWSINGEKNL